MPRLVGLLAALDTRLGVVIAPEEGRRSKERDQRNGSRLAGREMHNVHLRLDDGSPRVEKRSLLFAWRRRWARSLPVSKAHLLPPTFIDLVFRWDSSK